MRAFLVRAPFTDPRWLFERKLDGVRAGVIVSRGTVRLLSRSGHTMNATYPELVETLAAGSIHDLVADGEIVAFEHGRTSFARLQRRTQIHDPERARRSGVAVYLYLFDLLEFDGDDLRPAPLRERKQQLRGAFRFRDRLRWTPYRVGAGEAAYRHACARGWEGVIAKRADSPYVPVRSRDWRKITCNRGQELVIGGWTAGRGARRRLGALLLGYWEHGRLRYAGKVGTGFDSSEIDRLADELERRERSTPPFAGERLPRAARWAEPELVAQIAFTEWTEGGRLRHPCYLGLREDKPAREVVRERPRDERNPADVRPGAAPAPVRSR
ncbi:MAG: non-homologous end-joining DNA ligase [Gaiellaceae bacterium]